jgi:hypothetical protein
VFKTRPQLAKNIVADMAADLVALHPDGLVHAVPADVRDREDLAKRLSDLPDDSPQW